MTRKNYMLIAIFLTTIFTAIATLGFLPSVAFAGENTVEQYINLDYLKRIDGTPFAEKVSTVIKVPVYANHVILVKDVKRALHLSSFGVMQSSCEEFSYNEETDTYTAVYLKSVYLNAKTVDGNSMNYFLDCNLSYADFYGQFVADNIVEEGLYEYYWNKLRLVCEGKLEEYTANDVYGYWGLVAIPDSYTLDAVWADLFGTQTTYLGTMNSFVYSNTLTLASYNKLLNDYHYGFLTRVWNDIWGALDRYSANYYILYCDSEQTEFMVAENGASDINDNHGAIWNGVEEIVQDVNDALNTFFSDKSNIVKLFLGIVVLILILVLILSIIRSAKSFLKNSSRHKR